MSKRFKKATRPARAPRVTFRKLSRSVNEALSQVAAELDAMRRVISAIVTATDCDAGVRKALGMPPLYPEPHDECDSSRCRHEGSDCGGADCPAKPRPTETAQST